jgi:hypothetical protein
METSAQLPFRVTGQIGIGGPSETRDCMAQGYFIAGLGIETRGPTPLSPAIAAARFAFFGTARAEIFGAAGPIETCLILPRPDSLADGRILVNGHDEFELDSSGSQFALGAGARWSVEGLDAELRVNAGVARGQRHYSATWMRVVGASAAIVMFDHLVVSVEQRWYRVPRWEKMYTAQEWPGFPPGSRPAGSTTLHKWQPFRNWAIGYRF